MSTAERYVPAGRRWLTGLYDPVMALTMRERAFRSALVESALAAAPGLVLDLGCGTGTLAAALLEADPALRVVGVDGDQQVLARARAKTAPFADRVELRRALADQLPLDAGSIDVAIASLLPHHLAPAAKLAALREARRVLGRNGVLLIADWGRPQDPLMRAAFFALQLVDGFENTREHAAGELPELVARAGFGAVTVPRRWRTGWGSLELIAARAVF
jgi:ubiquinone/menaquinone biosynthesis C-methylase UbiE